MIFLATTENQSRRRRGHIPERLVITTRRSARDATRRHWRRIVIVATFARGDFPKGWCGAQMRRLRANSFDRLLLFVPFHVFVGRWRDFETSRLFVTTFTGDRKAGKSACIHVVRARFWRTSLRSVENSHRLGWCVGPVKRHEWLESKVWEQFSILLLNNGLRCE